MASQKGGSNGLEWRLTVSDGSSEELVPETSVMRRAWIGIMGLILALKLKAQNFLKKIWKLGVDDPRRVFHCFKVGMSLSIVSLFYYVRPLYDGVGGTAMWAVMTVVVVFEYSVGATLSKGLNRAIATLLAGSLAIGAHSIASRSGDKTEPVVVAVSVFLMASAATFSRFIPLIKTRFDYGVSIFILTFSLVSVSGYRVDKLMEMAQERLATIAIGGSMCMLVSMLVCPVWAGEDLHLLIARNMEKLASSLNGYITEIFDENESCAGNQKPTENTQGYKCVLNSKATEEALANFARWEPAHGQFGFCHPWKQYLKIGTTLRYCACCIEALNASTNSEIKAPEFLKKYVGKACTRLTFHSSSVLKEVAKTTKTMTKSSIIDLKVGEMNSAVEDLRNALKSIPNLLLQPPAPGEAAEEKKNFSPTFPLPIMEVLPLVTIASLLIEIAMRIERAVNMVNELAELAKFKPANDEKMKQPQPMMKQPQSKVQQGQEDHSTGLSFT